MFAGKDEKPDLNKNLQWLTGWPSLHSVCKAVAVISESAHVILFSF
jgi:hypothetical protein